LNFNWLFPICWGQRQRDPSIYLSSSTFFSYSLSDQNPVPIKISFLVKKVMQNELTLFWCIDIQLLQEESSYCYIIILLLDIRTTYIHQIFSLVNGLYQHNQGIGSLQMSDQRLCPWSLIAFMFLALMGIMRWCAGLKPIGRGGDSAICAELEIGESV
jgi:hypothetical protein